VRADAIKRQISFTEGAILVMREMVRIHSKILSDDTVKSSLEAYFLFQGAGNLVQFNYSDTKDDGARFNTGNIMAACYILLNEYQTDYAQWGCSKHEKELMKYEECFGRGSLCILMIFSNRIPCSCLDKKCEEVWSQPGEILKNMDFYKLPQPGDGFGKGRAYYPNEVTPWKDFCANCYAGAIVYRDYESYEVRTPNFFCSKCMMAWYCSEECQRQHWQNHKYICRQSTGTKAERKERKKLSRRWEKQHKEMLDKEREKVDEHNEKMTKQIYFNLFCNQRDLKSIPANEDSSSDEED